MEEERTVLCFARPRGQSGLLPLKLSPNPGEFSEEFCGNCSREALLTDQGVCRVPGGQSPNLQED